MPQTKRKPAKRKSTKTKQPTQARKPRRHCNALDGRQWIKNSISVWSDVRKQPEETKPGHPALFPEMLVERLIETFLSPEGRLVLDPFSGSGSTLIAAERAGKQGIGLEISPEYVATANARLQTLREASGDSSRIETDQQPECSEQPVCSSGSIVYCDSAANLLTYVTPGTIDLCITSPPYWNILNQRRTADLKAVRHYGNRSDDLGIIEDYEEFLTATTNVLADVFTALKPGAYCCVVVMDLRKKNRFFPLHSDLATRLVEVGYLLDDLIIWNRQAEYNNLRPLGYPSVFRVNKVHEYIVLMQKPREAH